MINLKDISMENWGEIMQSNSPEDIETIKYLHEHEEEILNILIENGTEKTLEQKRKEYIRKILSNNSYREDVDDVIEKIEEIRKTNNYSVLQFGKRLPRFILCSF